MYCDHRQDANPEAPARQLGKLGRRKLARKIAREAKVIKRSNGKILLKKFKQATTNKCININEIPVNPHGHFSVPDSHGWAHIHDSHKMVVTHRYAACFTCGKISSKNKTHHKPCQGHRTKKGNQAMNRLLHGRNPYSHPWKPDNAPTQRTYKCYKLQVSIRDTSNDKRVFKQQLSSHFIRELIEGSNQSKRVLPLTTTPAKHRRYNIKTSDPLGR